MKTFLFRTTQWMAFQVEELPVKPVMETYEFAIPYQNDMYAWEKAIAGLKSKALPVLNPEIAVREIFSDEPPQILKEVKEFSKVYTEIKEGEIYEWPGTAEKKEEMYMTNPPKKTGYAVYKLHLPNSDMRSKTKNSDNAENLKLENERIRQAYDYILASRNSVDKELNEANKENAALREAVKELLVLADVGKAYYRQNPGFNWVVEREKSEAAIEKARNLLKP
jgi:hypothetical protein